MSGKSRAEVQRYSQFEQASAGGHGASLIFYDDLTAELKLQQRSMIAKPVDGLIVFHVKPLHEMHGLLRVDKVLTMPEAKPIEGFRLAAQLWEVPVEDGKTEETFLSEMGWDSEQLIFAGATFEYLKTSSSVPRLPYDVGLIDNPNVYWNETFDIILFARFAPQHISDPACRHCLEWADKLKLAAVPEPTG